MGVASAIMKKATPRRYKYNSEKNIRVIFDLLQAIISIFSCLFTYIGIVQDGLITF